MYNSFVIINSVFFSFQTYVWAQDSNDLGTYGDWQATFWNEGGGICTMMTIPKKEEGKYTKRGEVYAQVVKNMGAKDTGVVNFAAGYSFKENSEVNIKIDDKHSFFYFIYK